VTIGSVTNLRAYVSVLHEGSELPCLIDTGFSGHLGLPPQLVDALRLRYSHKTHVDLADGSTISAQVYDALIDWQGYEVEVQVIATGERAILGTGLLAGWEFRAQFIEGGLVCIREIESD
jgi:clan AA aspartic protease